MTTLTITPDIAKKKLKLAGTVASGEKVAVTIAGFGTVATENLRLRVMAGDIPVGYFPLENEDAWTVSGDDLACTLNLATWQAERHCKFGAEVCFILEDTGTPQLYGVGDFSLRPWIKLSGVDVPENLDNYKVRMDALLAEINRVEGVANGKYTKPEAGIPKTDLAPSVRTSLDKADAVTLKVSKSAFDTLLGLSLPDSATQKDTRQIVQRILTVLQNAATCIALMVALPVFGIDGTTAWEDVPPDRTVKSVVEQFSPPADFSTNNTDLVETIRAEAPTPDLSPFLRSDKNDNEVQIFGGFLSGFGFHADTGHNDNGWNQYTAHNGTSLSQSLPSYIASNPWDFQKRGEAIPVTGGVFNAYIHLNQKFSVGTWTQSVKPIESVGGSGIAFAFGDNVQTKAANSMVLGVGALNTNAWSFIWNGDANRMYFPTMPNQSNPYATRYNGGFHVNPSVRSGMTNPLQNFWIGDTNLATWISTLAPVETDPTVPQWAKASARPTYTAAEVGALSSAGGTLLGNLTVESTGEKSEIRAEHGNEYIALQVKDNKATIETSDYSYAMPNSDGTVALTKNIPNVPAWALAAQKPTYTASEVGAYSTGEVDNILQGYLPLDYFRDGQTIPMYWGDGTKLCDFGANWLGNLAAGVQNNSDAIDAIGNYSVVSNRAMSAIQNSGTQAIDGVLEIYNSRSPNPPMERIKLYVDDDGVCHLGIDGIADYVIPLNLSGGTLALTSDITNCVAFVDAGAAIPPKGICLALAENYAYVTNAEEVVVGNVTNIVTTVTTNSYPVIALYKDGTKIWTSDPADESNIGWLIGLILALVGGAGTVLWRYFGKSTYTLKVDPETGGIYYDT